MKSIQRTRLLPQSNCALLARVLSLVFALVLTGTAAAQSPVAYVYVGETSGDTPAQGPFSPISAYAATSDGRLTQIKGSPFTQFGTTGIMIGTTGAHFIVAGTVPNESGDGPLSYLYSYEVGSNGVIGQQESVINTASYSGAKCTAQQGSGPAGAAAVLDHSGQYIYVPYCGDAIQTYKISKSGDLTFQDATTYSNPNYIESGSPKESGNGAFAYNQTLVDLPKYGAALGLNVFARLSDGSLESRGNADVTGPILPDDYYYQFSELPDANNYPFNYPIAALTNDSTDHYAAQLVIEKFTPPDTTANEGCAFASFTVGSHGELTSKNTYDEMPKGNCGVSMLLSPLGKTLAVNEQNSLQFFHFNGSEPITPFAQVVSKSGGFATIAWDKNNHLYALNNVSGRLHVYTVSSHTVVESPGSPYDVPFCGLNQGPPSPMCPQTLVVRVVP